MGFRGLFFNLYCKVCKDVYYVNKKSNGCRKFIEGEIWNRLFICGFLGVGYIVVEVLLWIIIDKKVIISFLEIFLFVEIKFFISFVFLVK